MLRECDTVILAAPGILDKCTGRIICTNTSKRESIPKFFVRKMKKALM